MPPLQRRSVYRFGKFKLNSLDGSTSLSLEAGKRFTAMNRNQKVTIYYTATKNQYMDSDSLALDDIAY